MCPYYSYRHLLVMSAAAARTAAAALGGCTALRRRHVYLSPQFVCAISILFFIFNLILICTLFRCSPVLSWAHIAA